MKTRRYVARNPILAIGPSSLVRLRQPSPRLPPPTSSISANARKLISLLRQASRRVSTRQAKGPRHEGWH